MKGNSKNKADGNRLEGVQEMLNGLARGQGAHHAGKQEKKNSVNTDSGFRKREISCTPHF